ncbi:DUF1553 domain-containing protein [Roseiconus lacunae]|uniref:DUF1553 domain-containing protein n=1 Tax=Roseiconus lacunae TaxID=2605694 RepID=UPI0030934DFB|nr:DUF1553 domain-containing protein [Stieleria sp. HD01]
MDAGRQYYAYTVAMRPPTLLTIACLLACGPAFASPQESQRKAEFLNQYCADCHSGDGAEADFRVDDLVEAPESHSKLTWMTVWRIVEEKTMPPEDAEQPDDEARQRFLGDLVHSHQLEIHADSTDHWSFHPITVKPASSEQGIDLTTAIDQAIEVKLNENGLSRSPVADRRTLIRRATLDLTGLPPTVESVNTFVSDRRPDDEAFGTVIERLLASDAYGERWAQHWLDVIRWAETVGFETNAERRNAYHYRDWVIQAFNDDMPYDEFIRHQIVGDVTGQDAALGFLVAGPANLPGQVGRDIEAMRQARQDELDEVIRTVSQSLFGLTIGCARCHDHKFDPISQRDYYSMQAIFAGLSYGDRRLRGALNDDWATRVPAIDRELALLTDELEAFRVDHQLRHPVTGVTTEAFAPIDAAAMRMTITQTTNGTASLYELEAFTVRSGTEDATNAALAKSGAQSSASSYALANQTRHHENAIDGSIDKRQAFPWVAANSGEAWIQVDFARPTKIDRVVWHAGQSTPVEYTIEILRPTDQEWVTVADSRDRLPIIADRRQPDRISLAGVPTDQVQTLVDLLSKIRSLQSQRSRFANGPQTYAARFDDSPEPTFLLLRGDPMRRADQVSPLPPKALLTEIPKGDAGLPNDDAEVTAEVGRRLTLVNHLTDPEHPLTARVIVNRVWQHHFGVGLVQTASDFGKMGAAPSHPVLLDRLAAELIDHQWSLKWLHRQIMMSKTYRQDSLPRDDAIAIDAESRLLWRFPPRRIDAETIRDSMLMISGKLNRTKGGKGFDFFNRRGGLSDYHPKETFDESGWRRMIYAHKIRMQSIDIFGSFDCPDAGQMTPRRNESVTPLQALGLFNSKFVMRQAAYFASRLQPDDVSAERSLAEVVDEAWQIVFSRHPQPEELELVVKLADQHGIEQVCRVLFNSSEFLYLK